MSNILQTTTSLANIAEQFNLYLIMDRDLGSEYQVIKCNYRNKKPDICLTEAKITRDGLDLECIKSLQ